MAHKMHPIAHSPYSDTQTANLSPSPDTSPKPKELAYPDELTDKDSPLSVALIEANQEIIELDNLEDIEFLLDEIEDQIAPLA